MVSRMKSGSGEVAEMITQKHLEMLAAKAGYQEPGDYACDHELERCEVCRKWGKWGDEVVMAPEPSTDYVCEKCHPGYDTEWTDEDSERLIDAADLTLLGY